MLSLARSIRPLASPRAALLALGAWLACPSVLAQQPGADPRSAAPLRAEPGDWWGDVHRWTGSDATRPARPAQPAARAEAPPPEGLRRVTTTATGRAKIRREPSSSAPVLRSLPPGTALAVSRETPDGWLQVVQDGRPSGWIHQSALQPP